MILLHYLISQPSLATSGFLGAWSSATSIFFSTESPILAPTPGILRNLRVAPRAVGAGSDTFQFIVRVNNVNTALTCTISESAAAASDTTNQVSVAAGDRVSIVVPSGANLISGLGYRAVIELALSFTATAALTFDAMAIASETSLASEATAAITFDAMTIAATTELPPEVSVQPIWTLPDFPLPSAPLLSAAEALFGRDIRFDGDLSVTAGGDWATVEGIAAVRQSILNEAMTSPGEHSFRPEYGMGLADAVKRPASKSTIDELKNRIRERCAANPRVTAVKELEVERTTVTTQGGRTVPAIRVTLRVESAGRDVRLDPIIIGGR